jgi:Transposase DDE domain group 1
MIHTSSLGVFSAIEACLFQDADPGDADRVRRARCRADGPIPTASGMRCSVTARVSAIACGHEDAIDLDRLRHDPLMKVAVGRCPETGAPLASQSTISRLENAPS